MRVSIEDDKDLDVFLDQMRKLIVKSNNKFLRSEAIKYLEKYDMIECIDLSDVEHIKKCR